MAGATYRVHLLNLHHHGNRRMHKIITALIQTLYFSTRFNDVIEKCILVFDLVISEVVSKRKSDFLLSYSVTALFVLYSCFTRAGSVEFLE